MLISQKIQETRAQELGIKVYQKSHIIKLLKTSNKEKNFKQPGKKAALHTEDQSCPTEEC